MTILDDVKDFLGIGPDSWDERLAPDIKFVSPEGNEFSAKWAGSPRTVTKKLGIFSLPKVKGNIVQDMEVDSNTYPIPFFFEGKDNDKEANRFFAVCKEKGPWEVTHPVHGLVGLQLITATENDQPITSGNVTQIDSEWIEPIDPATLKTARELSGIVDGLKEDLNISAVQEFANKVKSGTESLNQAIEDAVDIVEGVSEKVFDPLNTLVDAVDNTFNTIQNGINDILNATVLETQQLAGKVQNLIQTPALASNSLQSRLDIYNDASDGYGEGLPVGVKRQDLNRAATVELAMMSVVATNATIATSGVNQPSKTAIPAIADPAIKSQLVEPQTPPAISSATIATRAQAVAAAQALANQFNSISGLLGDTQKDFEGNDIDEQYFAQTTTYALAAQLTYTAIQFLLVSAFDLKIERRFVLDEPRCPYEIAVNEYGGPGENDENFDLFIESNGLKGDDIIYLPAGREVVVYI
jgi:prophage DNA circulation protein